MNEYPFFMLTILLWSFALPSILLRKDMRPHLLRAAVLSLPFAFTEALFIPQYWDPPFLFDLQNKIGFGLEDLLFVSGLGVAALGIPALVLNLALKNRSSAVMEGIFSKRSLAALSAALILCFVSVAISKTGFPAIYAATGVMALSYFAALWVRRDLAQVSLMSFLLGIVSYSLICAALEAIVPGVFTKYWHTEKLFNAALAGIPLEELLYGGLSFCLAVSLYPLLFDLKWEKKH